MHQQNLAGMGLQLHDIGGGRRIEALDQAQIAADLRDALVPHQQRVWFAMQPLGASDRILLAHDSRTGKTEGVLLLRAEVAADAPFLIIEALSSPTPRGAALLQRMLAYLILRLDTLEQKPAALLARTRNPSLCHVLHRVAGEVGGAFHPAKGEGPISFQTAGLAHRMVRVAGAKTGFAGAEAVLRADPLAALSVDGPLLVALDLRGIDDAQLVDSARRLFRGRLPGSAKRPVPNLRDMPRRKPKLVPPRITLVPRTAHSRGG